MLLNDTQIAYGYNLLPVAPASVQGDVPVPANTIETATFTSSSFVAKGRGANVLVNVTAVSGTTPTLAVKLQGLDAASGTWFDVPGAVTSSITATGATLLQVHPDLTAAANSIAKQVLPDTYHVVGTIGGTTPSFTLSVGVNYLA